MSDAAAVGISVAHWIGRLGCFLRGCDYGILAEGKLAWIGVSFPAGPRGPGLPAGDLATACDDQIRAGLIPPGSTWSLPVVPTQLIEVAIELGLTISLWWYLTRKPRPRAGSAFLIYWIAYGIARVLLEQLLRGDPGRGTLLGVSTSTAIGLGTSLLALVFLFVPQLARLRPERSAEAAPTGDVLAQPAPTT
jgi:phosphatidylglycerol:prolipoprotein diacylglycerol transferase